VLDRRPGTGTTAENEEREELLLSSGSGLGSAVEVVLVCERHGRERSPPPSPHFPALPGTTRVTYGREVIAVAVSDEDVSQVPRRARPGERSVSAA
jgi:hypothetical protein